MLYARRHTIFLLVVSLFLLPAWIASPQETEKDPAGNGGEEKSVSAAPHRSAVIPIEGEIDKFQVIFLRRSIEKARDDGVETIIFTINTFGGRVDSALQMATLIGSLEEISAIAYIPAEPESLGVSWSAGALISFSCNRIYMAPGTSIGAAAPVFQSSEGTQAAGEKTVSAVRTQLSALAEKNGYPKEVAVAMVDKEVELVEVREDGRRYFEFAGMETTEESASAGEEEKTVRRVVSPKGKLLTLTAGEMEEYGISSGTISPLSALYTELELQNPLRLTPSDADRAVGFLSSAAVTSMLLTIGLLALYLEISSPGFGVPGTVAILAFSVVFVSGGLLGTLGSMELILFLLGIALLVVEIFLIPGFGVAGISGLLLMSIGLILSRQSFILPDSDWQWELFLQNLFVVFGTFALSFILMGILMIFFPRIRLFQRLVLSATSPGGTAAGGTAGTLEGTESTPAETPVDEKRYPKTGSRGKVKSKLRPAGRVEIEGEIYSVVTDGDWVEAGEEVRVIERSGNRIVVERIDEREKNR